MSIVDKVIAAVTPPESEEARAQARAQANEAATPGDWLAQILEHHLDIEEAFAAVKAATTSFERLAEFKQLAVLLNGHSLAEEVVIYPLLGEAGQKAHAALAYNEQTATKVQMALLEQIEPMSQDFIDKLGHIEGAVKHHVYTEEGNWFLDLKQKATAAQEEHLTDRYAEEYARYVGEDAFGLSETVL